MKDRLPRRGRVKLKEIYAIIGDQLPFIIVDQRHTLLFESLHWQAYLGSKLLNLKVTEIEIGKSTLCYFVYVSQRFSRRYWRQVNRLRRRSKK